MFSGSCAALQDERDAPTRLLLRSVQPRPQIEDARQHRILNISRRMQVLNFSPYATRHNNVQRRGRDKSAEAINQGIPLAAFVIERIGVNSNVGLSRVEHVV